MISGFLTATVCFAGAFSIYLIVVRLAGLSSRFFVAGLAAWLLSLIVLLLVTTLPFGPKVILGITYTLLWGISLNVLAALANSVTLFMLTKMASTGERAFSKLEIKATFDQTDAIRGRILAMVTSGLVTESPAGFRITRRGRCLTVPFQMVKRGFAIRRVG